MSNSIFIGQLNDGLASFFQGRSYSNIFVVTDRNTHKFCYPHIKPLLDKHRVFILPPGESHKNLETCASIWAEMTRYELDRHALVINLGGGVIGDMGGFCAATYKRGVDFVQIPTTLLSQVDASVGGKLGIDFNGLKNHIGVFQLPETVLIDPAFLNTLSDRELRSGFAEIIKHCIIADRPMFEKIQKLDLSEQNLPELIRHSVAIKQHIVTTDPKEKGIRKTLNFGHTLGHAIETHFLSKPKKLQLLHGEAIAAGMIAESYISYRKKLLTIKELEEITEYLFTTYGSVSIPKSEVPAIINLTAQDKKNLGKKVRFALPEGIGKCAFDQIVSNSEMHAAIDYYTNT